VASSALDHTFGVSVTQTELCFVMLETTCRRFPIALAMTRLTLLAQIAIVFVILFVTTETVFGCLLEHGALVAFLALDIAMFSKQREATFVMVKPGRFFPASFAMATHAILAQGFLVLVIFAMT
jgi:hypothetical protein